MKRHAILFLLLASIIGLALPVFASSDIDTQISDLMQEVQPILVAGERCRGGSCIAEVYPPVVIKCVESGGRVCPAGTHCSACICVKNPETGAYMATHRCVANQ